MDDYDVDPISPLLESLTPRELGIVSLIADGMTNREIGETLHLAEPTVRWYNTQIFGKLGVKNRRQAVVRAQKLGLLDAEEESTRTTKHNLPWQTTLFVGRHQEMSELAHLLNNPDIRLITILGAGGMGKTRLALAIAEQQLRHFTDGVFLVPLAPLDAPTFMVSTIAENVGFQFYGGGDPQQQLLDFFREKQMLLVLDNFEHLLDGAPLVSDILSHAPDVKALVTSRERLNLRGETVFTLGGMGFPDWETPQDALAYDAVKLFMQSAKQARSDFELKADDLKYLARICRLAAGMPLAVVLAAGWLDVLTLEQIATEIQAGIDILETELRDVPERQRSVRATFNYSWNRLSETEREVFIKLSVFRGGFSIEAAAMVAGANKRDIRTLVNKSLVQALPTGRYDIHELLRQYAAEHLANTPLEYTQIRNQHCDYYCAFLGQQESNLKGRRELEALAEIEAVIDNVRVAWQWAIQARRAAAIRQAFEGLFHFYSRSSHVLEGVQIFHRAAEQWELTAPDRKDDNHLLILGQLLGGYGASLNVGTAAWNASVEPLERSLGILRQLDNPSALAFTLHWLGSPLAHTGREAEGKCCAQEGYDLYQTLGDSFGLANTLLVLGSVARHSGDLEEAKQFYQEGLALAETIGNKHLAIWSFYRLGLFATKAGEYQAAGAWYEKALSYAREVNNPTGISLALGRLATISSDTGDHDQARRYSEEMFVIARNAGNRIHEVFALNDLGRSAWNRGNLDEAELLFQTALAKAMENHLVRVWALVRLAAVVSERGDYAASRRHSEEALAISREVSDRRGDAYSLDVMGFQAYLHGFYTDAKTLCESSLAIYQELGDRYGIAGQNTKLGHINAALDDFATSQRHYMQALRECWDMQTIPEVLEIVAGLAHHRANGAEFEHAVEYLALAVTHRATIFDVKQVARSLEAELKAELLPEVYAAAWQRGESLDLDTVVAELLEEYDMEENDHESSRFNGG